MEPLPYSHALAKAIFDGLLGIFAVLELRTRVRTRANQTGTSPERLSFVVLAVTLGGGIAGALVAASKLESLAIGAGRVPLFVLGALLAALGIGVRTWAIAVLGSSFTVEVRVRPGQPVVESGPYRWVCHPSYTGLLLIFAGIGLMLGNWASLLLLAMVPTLGLLFRIRAEERALLAVIGEPYRRFLAGRARLLPGIW